MHSSFRFRYAEYQVSEIVFWIEKVPDRLFTYSTDAMKPAKNMAMLPAYDFSGL
jgi:hypothetical protein